MKKIKKYSSHDFVQKNPPISHWTSTGCFVYYSLSWISIIVLILASAASSRSITWIIPHHTWVSHMYNCFSPFLAISPKSILDWQPDNISQLVNMDDNQTISKSKCYILYSIYDQNLIWSNLIRLQIYPQN